MKRAIVTGANGFVGSAVVRKLIHYGWWVIALDLPGHNENLPQNDRCMFVPCELANMIHMAEVLKDFGADIFYHFAWVGSAGLARANVEVQLHNVQWSTDSLNLAKKIGCTRYIAAGSIMEHETLATTNTDGCRPDLGCIYGGAKLMTHMVCKTVAADIGIDFIWAEITNAYGVGEFSPRLINATIRKILNKEELHFTAATQNYDFVYIDDVAEAFYLIGENGKPFHKYIIGSSTARPLKEFLLEMQEVIAPELAFSFGTIPFKGINLPMEQFDCLKTQQDTGFVAKISFAEGVRKTKEWIIQEGPTPPPPRGDNYFIVFIYYTAQQRRGVM